MRFAGSGGRSSQGVVGCAHPVIVKAQIAINRLFHDAIDRLGDRLVDNALLILSLLKVLRGVVLVLHLGLDVGDNLLLRGELQRLVVVAGELDAGTEAAGEEDGRHDGVDGDGGHLAVLRLGVALGLRLEPHAHGGGADG